MRHTVFLFVLFLCISEAFGFWSSWKSKKCDCKPCVCKPTVCNCPVQEEKKVSGGGQLQAPNAFMSYTDGVDISWTSEGTSFKSWVETIDENGEKKTQVLSEGSKTSSSKSNVSPISCTRTCGTTTGEFKEEVCTFACSKVCVPKTSGYIKMTPKKVPKDFDLFDENKDGVITMKEMSDALSMPLLSAIEPFQMADQDGNDKLSKYEFEAAPWNFECKIHDKDTSFVALRLKQKRKLMLKYILHFVLKGRRETGRVGGYYYK